MDTPSELFFRGCGRKIQGKIHEVLGARAVIASPTHCLPRASSVAMAAFVNRDSAVKYDEVKANYLRRSEAEVTWEKKHGKQSDQ